MRKCDKAQEKMNPMIKSKYIMIYTYGLIVLLLFSLYWTRQSVVYFIGGIALLSFSLFFDVDRTIILYSLVVPNLDMIKLRGYSLALVGVYLILVLVKCVSRYGLTKIKRELFIILCYHAFLVGISVVINANFSLLFALVRFVSFIILFHINRR